MKKVMMLAIIGLMFMGGMNVFSQEDSTEFVSDEPKDTISIDNMDPVFYEEDAAEEHSNGVTYAIIGGIVVIGGGAFYFIRKKKKQ